jgi:nicotinamidase-related amidase
MANHSKLSLEEKVSPEHTALLVIDIQVDFCAPSGIRGQTGGDLSMMEPMIDRLLPFIQTAENAGILTLYTQQIYDREKLSDLQKEQYDLDGKMVMVDIATEGHKLYRIDPSPEKVFPKYNYNAFSDPDLIATLMGHYIKTLVITGVDTFYCVETAIRNAHDLGYKVVVPDDLVACNAKHLDLHENTLKLVRKSYGVVSSAAQLSEIWHG